MSQEPLYIVRDGAGATYGPAAIAMLRQWIAEGRITAHMEVALQGTEDFRPAEQLPELASAFAPAAAPATTPNPATTAALPNPAAFNQAAAPQAYGVYSKSSGLAIASLICSLCGFIFCGLPAVVGIILGHIARGQIRREPERYEGMGMATAGLVIGYCLVGLAVLVILAYIIIIVVAVGSGGFR